MRIAALVATGVWSGGGAVAPLCICGQARAENYPSRTIYPSGGAVDVMARGNAEKLSSTLGQEVVVDNLYAERLCAAQAESRVR